VGNGRLNRRGTESKTASGVPWTITRAGSGSQTTDHRPQTTDHGSQLNPSVLFLRVLCFLLFNRFCFSLLAWTISAVVSNPPREVPRPCKARNRTSVLT
jgi:hypothetical protein